MSVTISIEISGTFDLTPEQVWPDGVPEEWTIADVVAAVKTARSVNRLIDDWCMTPSVDVTVMRTNPAWNGDEVLFGKPPPRILTECAEVWA